MTKYIVAYKRENEDKWYKYAVVSTQAKAAQAVADLFQVISKVEKIQIQKVIR